MWQRTIALLRVILTVLVLGLATALTAAQAGRVAGPAETHEGVTVTAQPWTEPATYKTRFPKKNPRAAGIVAIQFTLQNDSAETVRVNLERIRLLVTIDEDVRQDLTPLSSEDVADLVLKGGAKDPTVKRNRIPLPIGKPKGSRTKEWTEIEQAVRDAGVPSSVVPPHGKVQGLLYFDLVNQFDLLRNARLYVPEVVSLEKGRSLLYFEIDLSKAPPL